MSEYLFKGVLRKLNITYKVLWIIPAIMLICQPLAADVIFENFRNSQNVNPADPKTSETEDPELDQLRENFRNGKILEAQMTHEFLDSYTGETQVTKGKIWISQSKYKIQADQQVVVVDGVTSRVYNEQQNKLVISHYEPTEDDFAPSRFFSDDEKLYYVSEVIRDSEIITYVLKSDDTFEIFLEVRIILDKNLKPVRIRAVDQMDNILETSLTEARYLQFDDTLFQMDYPKNAEIIDLRK